MSARELPLSAVAAAVLAVMAQGCCINPGTSEQEVHVEGEVSGELLQSIRDEESTDSDRCRAACAELAEQMMMTLEEIPLCADEGDEIEDDAWAIENTAVTIRCTGTFTADNVCMGRRPTAHHESAVAIVDLGTWFAVHAHLEAASIAAFAELADWLARHDAPAELVARCRLAGADEVVHARLLERLARHEGCEPPTADAGPPVADALAVAIHNAVEGCVHEAFAAIVAAHQASHAQTEELRAVFGRIAADELRHGQLAWDLHRWLLASLDPDDRAQVLAAQRAALADLPRRIADAAVATPGRLGWPSPAAGARMAVHFAALLQGSTSSCANSHA